MTDCSPIFLFEEAYLTYPSTQTNCVMSHLSQSRTFQSKSQRYFNCRKPIWSQIKNDTSATFPEVPHQRTQWKCFDWLWLLCCIPTASKVFNCALYSTVIATMKFLSNLLFLSLVASSISIKHPDVSKNEEFCYKSFMQDIVHNCYCEPFKEGFLEGKHSYLWQYVSNIYTHCSIPPFFVQKFKYLSKLTFWAKIRILQYVWSDADNYKFW